MAKTNTLRLAAVVAASIASFLAALLLVPIDPNPERAGAAISTVDRWATVEEVTGTVTYVRDAVVEETTPSGGRSVDTYHDSLKMPSMTLHRIKSPTTTGHWNGRGTAVAKIDQDFRDYDSGGKLVGHLKRYGTVSLPATPGLAVGTGAVNYLKLPDWPQDETFSGDYYSFNPGTTTEGCVPDGLTIEYPLSGTSSKDCFTAYAPYIQQPLSSDGLTLTGSATSLWGGSFISGAPPVKTTWNLTGTPAQPPAQKLSVSADLNRACPNRDVTFTARNQKGHPVNAKWSGDGKPQTGSGNRFTTSYTTHGSKTVTAKTSSASATKTIKVLRESGPWWQTQFPQSNRTKDLSSPFRENVEDFLAALRTAGLKDATNKPRPASNFYDINTTYRPSQRAHLMYYSYKVSTKAIDPRKVPAQDPAKLGQPQEPPVDDICWAHYDSQGNFDLAASRAAASRMYAAYQAKHPPAHPSRHEAGEAIDMRIQWTGTLNIADANNNMVRITQPAASNGSGNPKLWDVGATYDVIKFERKNPNSKGDPPHWSVDGK
jgi:hypothetical protein